MILLDTSFLVAFFKEDDSQHEKSIQDMKRYEQNKEEMLITEHVLGETATVLLYYHGLSAATCFLDFTKEKCIIQKWDKGDMEAALKVFREQKNQLSYIDACLVYLGRFSRIRVATYDEKILKEIKEITKR
ncbi:MAG: PIN domain-containing protein [Candidatus Micrarchaeia archaeon]